MREEVREGEREREGERRGGGQNGTPLHGAHVEGGIVGEFSCTKHQVLLLPL